MSELMGIARFRFHDGGAEEFKRLSARCVEIVRTQDTGTLGYDIFLNEDESEAIVLERYVDAAALEEHLAHIGPELMQEVVAVGDVHGETLGEVPDAMREQLRGGPVQLFVPYLSMGGSAGDRPGAAS